MQRSEYLRALKTAWARLEELEQQPPDAVTEDTYEEVAEIVEELRVPGLKLGFGDLLPFTHQSMRPHDAMSIVGRLMERCRQKDHYGERKKNAADDAKPAPSAASDVLTVPEAAEYLKCGQNTIRDLCNAGQLRHSRIGTRRGHIRIDRMELDRWRQESEQTQQDRSTPLYRNLQSP